MAGDLIRVFRDGRPAAGDDLRAPALRNEGHFTTLQVRAGATQGLGLHLRRLCEANRELFGVELDGADLRRQLRRALQADGRADCTLRASIHAPGPDLQPAATAAGMLVAISPPLQPPVAPVRVRSFVHARAVPHLKHTGTFDLFHHRRLAVRAGFDDALFLDTQGRVLEGATWNVGFIAGQEVVWPQGAALRGVTERLLQAGLAADGVAQHTRPVPLGEVAGFCAAFACNTRGVWLLGGVDAAVWPGAPEWERRLSAALAARPRERI